MCFYDLSGNPWTGQCKTEEGHRSCWPVWPEIVCRANQASRELLSNKVPFGLSGDVSKVCNRYETFIECLDGNNEIETCQLVW